MTIPTDINEFRRKKPENIAAIEEIEQNHAALKVVQQNDRSLLQRTAVELQRVWDRLGEETASGAREHPLVSEILEYLKEKSVAELSAPRQRYYAPGDLLEVPADAEIDELGRYDRCKTVYLASDVDKQP